MSAAAQGANAPAASAGVPRAPEQQRRNDGGFLSSPLAKSLMQAFAVWLIVNNLSSFLQNRKAQPQTPATNNRTVSAIGNATASGGAIRPPQLTLEPLWAEGAVLDVLVKLSTATDGRVDFQDDSLPSVRWDGVEYKNSKWSKQWDTLVNVPTSVQKNGSLWADIFIVPTGTSPDTSSPLYEPEHLHIRKLLTRYHAYRKPRVTKNLLSKGKETPEELAAEAAEIEREKNEPRQIVSYWHPNVTLELVCGSGNLMYSGLPPVLQRHVHRAKGNETNDKGNGYFYPITYANDFWLLREQMTPVNTTTPRLPLRITLGPTSHWKWQIMASLDESFSQAADSGGSSGEMDEVKRMLTETSPWLLITTTIVTIHHMVFEILAFTSDVSHWRKKKDNLVGVSVRTIVTNVVVQLIILLYLLDNNENTSWMILFSSGTGVLIEAWKIPKTVDIKLVPKSGIIPYRLEVHDKHKLTEEELKTQEADKLAFKIVGYATVPLLGGYTIYSLYYNEHRSWYSFVITTLTMFVQAFGFVQMLPQIVINYKLKSVAHMPMKALTYKFLTTIVDDFFSFIIKMPWLHRLACFRDDVVFVILLYQMWIYKTDYSRANEYGQKLTDEAAEALLQNKEDKEKEKVAVDAKGKKLESRKDR
ncbi:hypothetical protein OIV83_001061 [Microbotryomycetes sp. JL201]|nr:hypothetical protein OIV83_001061 [Microbotryomycetes sp. JL201]